MTISSLVTAGSLAHKYGIKNVVYSQPREGKTPLLETLVAGGHRPVLCITEPGLRTLGESKMMAYPAYTTAAIMEFMKWRLESAESQQFDVTVLDSGSEMCEIFLRELLGGTSKAGNKKHGEQAYGEMAEKAYNEVFAKLFYAQGMHVVINCKQMQREIGGVQMSWPYFPGQKLLDQFPHLYDNIMHLEPYTHTDGKVYKVLRCEATYNVFAGNRNRLDSLEPADLAHIIRKSLQRA